jgi:aspartate/methionine/tyrosine aminotransferase
MRFSARSGWELEENPLARLAAAKRAAGGTLLDLTASNPTTCDFVYPTEAILAALADPAQMRYAPHPTGAASARAAVAAYYRERGAAVDPAQVVLTASTSEAYAWCFKLLAGPGDAILIPQPSYPLFEYLAGLEAVRAVPYPLRYDGEWHIDFPALAARLTPETRAVILVHPNNPTGSFLKQAEYARLVELCHAHHLALICDEVFADFAAGADAGRMGTPAGQDAVLTFTLSGLSKVAGLPQMKLSWMVVSGPVAERAAALARLEVIADTYLSVGTPVQLALPRLLELGGPIREQIRARVAANRRHLDTALADLPAHALPAEGGWYAIVRLPALRREEEWATELLAEDDVLVQPGYFYDLPFAPALVISLLPPPAIFHEGIARLVQRIRSTNGHE